MSKYRTSYIQSHCIELFFRYRGTAIHVMTDGNTFPDDLNNLEVNRDLQRQLAMRMDSRMFITDNITINPSYEGWLIEHLQKEQDDGLDIYTCLDMFISMAKQGFHSYDCVGMDANGKWQYVLVAYPTEHNINAIVNIPSFEGIIPIVDDEELVGFWM